MTPVSMMLRRPLARSAIPAEARGTQHKQAGGRWLYMEGAATARLRAHRITFIPGRRSLSVFLVICASYSA